MRESLIGELRTALGEVKTLHGLLPICAKCKNVRNDDGYWERIEGYLEDRSDAVFTHGMCPECITEFYGDVESETPPYPSADGEEHDPRTFS
jgi:hypothetical protein